jgi:hypothetical protein
MKWTIRILAGLVLLWAIYFVSPYAALYQFGRALSQHDAAALTARLDIEEVRKSVARQLVAAYLKATGREAELGRPSGQLKLDVGAWAADPLVAEYVSPERIIALLNGQPGAGPAPGAELGAAGGLGSVGPGSAQDLWDLVRATERRGFTKVAFSLPLRQPAEARYELLFRLSHFTWILAGVDLPAVVERRLVQEIMARQGAT